MLTGITNFKNDMNNKNHTILNTDGVYLTGLTYFIDVIDKNNFPDFLDQKVINESYFSINTGELKIKLEENKPIILRIN